MESLSTHIVSCILHNQWQLMIQRINVPSADDLLEYKHNTQFICTVIIHKSFIKDFLLHI